MLNIALLQKTDAIPYDLLQLADPSADLIDDYLKNGQCYIARLDSKTIGVLVMTELSPESIEIKNIAIHEAYQQRGFGKQLLQYAEQTARHQNYKQLVIGTGNSSVGQVMLYQKAGFEIDHVKKDFFTDHYPEPIFENGIQCKHMIVLVKKLA